MTRLRRIIAIAPVATVPLLDLAAAPAGAKTSLVDLLSQSIDATDTAVSDLEAAGVPDAQNAKKINTTILTALQNAKGVFADKNKTCKTAELLNC